MNDLAKHSLRIGVVTALLGELQFGFSLGVLNPVLGRIALSLEVSKYAASGLVTVLVVGACVGALIAGSGSDKFGLKTSLIWNAILFCVGGFLSACSPGYWGVWAGRFITGMGTGVASLLSPRYAAEISPPASRGVIGSLNQVAICTGLLLSYLLGLPYEYGLEDVWMGAYLVPWWRVPMLVGGLIALAHLVSALLCLESPQWLAGRGRFIDSQQVCRRLWGGQGSQAPLHEYQLDAEAGAIEHAPILEDDRSYAQDPLLHEHQVSPRSAQSGWTRMRERRYSRMVALAIGINILQQLGGINSVLFYSSDVLKKVGLASPIMGTVIIGAVNLLFSLVATYFIESFGRKVLWVSSHAGCAVALGALSAVMIVLGMINAPYLGVACMLLFVASFGIGAGPVTWLYTAEILPLEIKGPVASLATCLNWVCNILIASLFPVAVDMIGVGWTYAAFAGVNVFAVIYGLALMIETKQKPMDRIHAELMGHQTS